MMKSHICQFFVMLTGLFLCACSASRDLPEGIYMLDKVKVLTDGKYKDIPPSQMKAYVRQKANSRWFSTLKIPLGVYAMAGKDSTWLNKMLRSMGEAPVIYDSVLARQTCEDLQMALQNRGYLDAEVSLYIDKHKKKADAIYVLRPGMPYRIQHLERDIQDSLIAGLLKDRRSLLYDGMQFSADMLNEERSEITHYLQDFGYFRFHKEFITYKARKDVNSHTIDLAMVLHPYRSDSEASDTLHSRYKIRDLNFVSGAVGDSVIHLRESVLRENTFLHAGDYYSASDLQCLIRGL